MHLGKVMGTVTATVQTPGTQGIRYLIVQPLDTDRRPKGEPVICADATLAAGAGETVTFIGGREAAVACPETFVPVDHAIIGIVDHVEKS